MCCKCELQCQFNLNFKWQDDLMEAHIVGSCCSRTAMSHRAICAFHVVYYAHCAVLCLRNVQNLHLWNVQPGNVQNFQVCNAVWADGLGWGAGAFLANELVMGLVSAVHCIIHKSIKRRRQIFIYKHRNKYIRTQKQINKNTHKYNKSLKKHILG